MPESLMDDISRGRLADTRWWSGVARQQCADLALDAPVNPGLESLEEFAAAAEEALTALMAEATRLAVQDATPPEPEQVPASEVGAGDGEAGA